MNTTLHLPTFQSILSAGLRSILAALAALTLCAVPADAKPAARKPQILPFLGHTQFTSTLTVVEPGVRWIVTGVGVGHEDNFVGDFTVTFTYDINLVTGFLTGQVQATDLAGDQFGGPVFGRLTATGSEGFVLVNFGTGRFAGVIGLSRYDAGPESAEYKGAIILGLGRRR